MILVTTVLQLGLRPSFSYHIQGSPNNFFFLRMLWKKTTEYFLKFVFPLKIQSFRLIIANNFIQKAASSGDAVAYTIGPFFKYIIDCVQHCPLKHQLSLLCRRNTYRSPCPRNNNPTVSSQLRGGKTTSALRLIRRSSKTGRKTSSVASAVWHGAP